MHGAKKIVVPCLYGKVKNIVFIVRPGQCNDIPCVLDLYQYGYRICSVFILLACGIADLNIVFKDPLVNVNLDNLAYILLKVCCTGNYLAFPEFAMFNKFIEKGARMGTALDVKLIGGNDV
jgi:hypothetical protein